MTPRASLPLLALVVVGGCAAAPGLSREEGTLPPGQWGGDQIALEISADGSGHVELSCGSADFAGPVKVGLGGHFLTTGRYVRGTGVATMEPPASVPANISGRLDRGGILWLDIAVRDAYPVRSARLQRGVEPKLLRCL